MTNLAQNLLDTAAKEGAAPALRMDEFHLSFEEFRDAALRVAAGLRSRGVEPGDRVGMVLPNVLSFPIVFYGALLSGAAVVPMNPLLKAREIEYYLRDSGARVVVAGEQSAEPAAEAARAVGVDAVTVGPATPEELMVPERLMTPADRADDDTAVILYTPGTTGPAKRAGRPGRRRHGGDPLHVGDDGTAQGCRAHARQPEQQRPHDPGDAPGSDAGRRDHGLPAALPRLRADLLAERRRPGRGLAHAHPPVRRRQGPVGDRTRRRDDLPGCPHDVLRDAAPARPGEP